MSDINDKLFISNPLDLVPNTPKVVLTNQRKREIEIPCDRISPDRGWTHGQVLRFTLTSDVAFLDLKHMVIRAKYRQNLISEVGKIFNMQYANIEKATGVEQSFESTDADSTTSMDTRVMSFFDLDYGDLSLFKTFTIKVNDKVFYKMEDMDVIRKFVYLQTALEKTPSEFTKRLGGSLAQYKETNFDNDVTGIVNGKDTWFDIVISFSSLFDQFPLFPIYKLVGDITFEFTLNDAARAFAPVIPEWKLYKAIDATPPAGALNHNNNPFTADIKIKWTEQPKMDFALKDPKIQFYALEMMNDAAKNFENLSEHFLLNTVQYRDIQQAVRYHTIDLGVKSPSIRYVFHSLINKSAETHYIEENKYFNLGRVGYTVTTDGTADNKAKFHFDKAEITPALALHDGILNRTMSTSFTLPILDAHATIGNLKYPSDRNYERNLDFYLQKAIEFYGYDIKETVTSKPLVRYEESNLWNVGQMLDHTILEATTDHFYFVNPTGLNDGYFTDNRPCLLRKASHLHTKPFVEQDYVDNPTAITANDFHKLSSQATYLWNFSKMPQKGNTVLGTLNSQFNNVYFHYNMSEAFPPANLSDEYVWRQIICSDAKEILNTATGNMELFI